MDKSSILYENLEKNIPFCFIKMNDGEISAVFNVDASLSRGDERSSYKMSLKLKDCLEYNHNNYYIGLPCSLCYNEYYNKTIQLIESKESWLNANVLINTNVDNTLNKRKNTTYF